MCSSAGSIPDLESSHSSQACCPASCGQCGGDGCTSVVDDTDSCISDIVEDDEAFSVTGSISCDIDDDRSGSERAACSVDWS